MDIAGNRGHHLTMHSYVEYAIIKIEESLVQNNQDSILDVIDEEITKISNNFKHYGFLDNITEFTGHIDGILNSDLDSKRRDEEIEKYLSAFKEDNIMKKEQ